MARRVLRYEVPVDDEWHEIEAHGVPVHVASRRQGVVEFWADPVARVEHLKSADGTILAAHYSGLSDARTRWFRVYGTGEQVDGAYVGTTFDAATPDLVWHLFVRDAEPPEESTERGRCLACGGVLPS